MSTSTNFTIRPVQTEADYLGVAAVVNAFEPEPLPLDIVAQWFTKTAAGRIEHRRVAVDQQDKYAPPQG